MKKILSLAVCLAFHALSSQAQVVPDNTLGIESSTIRSINDLKNVIEGGAIRGDNLFHSFEEFSVREGFTTEFINLENIVNIFSRVTGDNISEILGTLSVDGAANLFLMNPNGIVFGENAAINVKGSFLAATAESIEFNSGDRFSAVEPDKPLLTIDFPIGLGMGSNKGASAINVRDKGHSLVLPVVEPMPTIKNIVSPGLQANRGENIALIGGEVNFDGGILIAEKGAIELGGVRAGLVKFDIDLWEFDYSDVLTFGDVNLYNTSWLDASNVSSSNFSSSVTGIEIKGRNIVIKDESVILSQNFAESKIRGINLNATDAITISKIQIDPVPVIPGGVISEAVNKATGGNIYLNAPNIRISDGGSVISRTIGSGKAGDIKVNASNQLELIGASELDVPPVLSNISNIAFPIGTTGIININAPFISITDGATITSIVAGNAKGKDITINADNIRVSGTDNVSGLSASSISSSSSGLSEGADIHINAVDVQIEQGATIAAFSFDTGKLGNININASSLIKVDGFASQTKNPSSVLSTVILADEGSREIFAQIDIDLSDSAISNSGNLNIQTAKLNISNNAIISVINLGTGNAGNLQINAEQVFLNNASQISASALSGEGGNIFLNIDSMLELSNRSQITATAGAVGNGGNIEINADNIIGFGNSDITANAFEGNGGNIKINADTILGIYKSENLTAFSDITADSELGIDGTVTINSPDTNADDEALFSARSPEPDRIEKLFDSSCLNLNRSRLARLIIRGRGIPETPYSYFDRPTEYVDADPEASVSQSSQPKPKPHSRHFPPAMNEPNAIEVSEDGRRFLVALTPEEVQSAQVCQQQLDADKSE